MPTKKSILLTKNEIEDLVFEGLLNEGLFGNPKLEQSKKDFISKIKAVCRRDKEINAFCNAMGITDPNTALSVASCTYRVAKAVDVKMVQIFSRIGGDIKPLADNIYDILSHENVYDVPNRILTEYAGGNKYIAYNIWCVLTDVDYSAVNDRKLPRMIDPKPYAGTMPVIGDNPCKYTQWSLLWALANKTNGLVNTLSRKDVADIIKRMVKLRNYRVQLDQFALAKRNALSEAATVKQPKPNAQAKPMKTAKDEEKRVQNELIKLWKESVNKYSKFFGNAVEKMFICPDNLLSIATGGSYGNYGTLYSGGEIDTTDNEMTQDELDAEIENTMRELGLKRDKWDKIGAIGDALQKLKLHY